jgi:hypothetical protein
MYSPSFITSEVASAQEAAAAGRYDISERKLSSASSLICFNSAVCKASAGDFRGARRCVVRCVLFLMTCVASRPSRLTRCTPGAIDELSVNISVGHVLPLILRAVCLSQASVARATAPPLRCARPSSLLRWDSFGPSATPPLQ